MRNENCDRKPSCDDYKYNHCDGCGGNKPAGDEISREALKKEVSKKKVVGHFNMLMAKKFKRSATTLTTRWLAYDDLDYHLTDYCCENCKVHMATYNIKDFKFCHNCGAKVTGVVSI